MVVSFWDVEANPITGIVVGAALVAAVFLVVRWWVDRHTPSTRPSMAEPAQDLYQRIGKVAVNAAGDDLGGRLVVFAEVERGVSTVDLLYKNRRGEVQLLPPGELAGLVYGVWKRWDELGADKQRWRAMEYVVEADHKLDIHLIYPNEFDENEDELARRKKVIRKYFGDASVIDPPDRFA